MKSGVRMTPVMSSLQSLGGMTLRKSKDSQNQFPRQNKQLKPANKTSHNIEVAINEETSSQAITRFQIYKEDSPTRNIENRD
jgi:hypothetical protein